MTDRQSAKEGTTVSAERTTATDQSPEGFTAEERAAMKARAKEMKAEGRRGRGAKGADAEGEVLAKIAEMGEPDRALGERIHRIVRANAPSLSPKLWYGMPAYAKDGKVLCFFQAAEKFNARYATFGFNDIAALDEGSMWPTSFALTALAAEDEATIAALVRKAVG